MSLVITEDGLVDESTLAWKIWREDHGESWTIVHELKARDGRVIRRDVWVNFKVGALPAAGAEQGGL